MTSLLRVLSRVVGAVLMIALALLGLGVALYCFDGLVSLGSIRPDRLLHLPSVRRHVGHVLLDLRLPGTTAGLALLCGLGAIAIGVLLLIGLLAPRRRHIAVLEDDDAGVLGARPAVLRTMAQALAQQSGAATEVRRPALRLRRRGTGGRLTVRASRSSTSEQAEVVDALRQRLAPLTDPFSLRPRIRVVPGEDGERVR
jgi:hypothetical protein